MKKNAFLPAAILLLALSCGVAQAVDAQLSLQVSESAMAGPVRDGTVLARGQIVSAEVHNGFQIELDASNVREPQRYVLSGQNNSNRKLRVRLEGRNWQPDSLSGKGIVLRSSQPSAQFVVVVDGDQQVAVDRWQLVVKGGAN